MVVMNSKSTHSGDAQIGQAQRVECSEDGRPLAALALSKLNTFKPIMSANCLFGNTAFAMDLQDYGRNLTR